MPATTIISRNAPARVRGLLASCACELSPGVYVAGQMSKGVRERLWHILGRWFPLGADYSIILTWPDKKSPGGIQILTLGLPPYEVVQLQGLAVVRTPLTQAEEDSLITEEDVPF